MIRPLKHSVLFLFAGVLACINPPSAFAATQANNLSRSAWRGQTFEYGCTERLEDTNHSQDSPLVAADAAAHVRKGDSPWRLGSAIGAPPWLHIVATHRTRYEHLQNQFRLPRAGNDMALSLRTTLGAEVHIDIVRFGIELADSRVYLAGDLTPLNTSHVNPFDILQAYVGTTAPNALAEGARLRLKLGRQTLDVGSRRLVARNRFRNTVNAFSGLDVEWEGPRTETVRAFVTVPVQRRSEPLRDNGLRWDIERTESLFWGLFLRSRPLIDSVRVEAYLFGLHEGDASENATRNRGLFTPGARAYRAPQPGRFDFEAETVLQIGRSRLTTLPEDTVDLNHLAVFLHASIGHTFNGAWQPRIVLQYDYASGDKDPFDESNGRFETLFGARRFEFGPTGIYGAFGRGNIRSLGVRAELQASKHVNGLFAYRPAWLAQERDRWMMTQMSSTPGETGTFLGHQVEVRVRWGILPGNLTFEVGFAHLWGGEVAFNTAGGNTGTMAPSFIYTQLGWQM